MSNITLYSLSDYNAGNLIPHTFDLDTIDTRDEWYQAVSEWLEAVDKKLGNDIYTPKREEWIVCDYEDIPSCYVGEWDIDDTYWTFKETVEASSLDLEVFKAAADCDIPPEDVEDCYQGEFSTDEDFAYELAESTGAIDEGATWPMNCIDWESAARELMMEYTSHNGHYFSSY